MMRRVAIGFGVVAVAAAALIPAVTANASETQPLATPPGVTLQSARLGQAAEAGGVGARQITKDVFADAKGLTLYTFEKDSAGKSACNDECAKAWPPLLVTGNADAGQYAGWSVVARADGAKQWAFQGKPLYTYGEDARIGDASGNGQDNGAWRLAGFSPGEGIAMPVGIVVQQLPAAMGEVFVSEATGTPLYTFDNDMGGKPACVGECLSYWPPFVAAQIARPIGDFTVVRRDDGLYQWALKGKPLYTFTRDTVAGDVKGDGAMGKWHAAKLLRHFTPPGVTVTHNRYGGENFATAEGKTLYVRNRVLAVNTGHSEKSGLKGIPVVGRILGASTCVAECTKTWVPLGAPADAQSSGYWEVVARPEGTKQWAYRGFPVYSYVGDQKPGDLKGNNIYDIMRGEDPYKAADVGMKAAGAMVWHTAVP